MRPLPVFLALCSRRGNETGPSLSHQIVINGFMATRCTRSTGVHEARTVLPWDCNAQAIFSPLVIFVPFVATSSLSPKNLFPQRSPRQQRRVLGKSRGVEGSSVESRDRCLKKRTPWAQGEGNLATKCTRSTGIETCLIPLFAFVPLVIFVATSSIGGFHARSPRERKKARQAPYR